MGKSPKVLITKLASMGDLVHLLPALTDAKKNCPGISFDWIIDKNFHEIASWHPSIDKIIQTNHRQWRKKLSQKSTFKEIHRMIQEVKKTDYDLVIDAHGNFKTAILSLFAKGPLVGFSGSSIPEWGAHFFYKKKAKVFKKNHAIEKLRSLFAFALGYEMPNNEPSYEINENQLIKPNIDLPSSFILVAPITSHPSKLWTESNWKELIEKLTQSNYFIVIPGGNEQELKRAKRLVLNEKVIALPKLPLGQVAYIIQKAKAMISLDTGLSHIAAALGTPNITLYGPTDPLLTGTKGKNQRHIKTSNLSSLSSEEVFKEFVLLESSLKNT